MRQNANHRFTVIALGVAFVLVGGASGCDGGRDDRWDTSRVVLGPVALKDRVAYVDGARDRVVILEATVTPVVHHVAVGRHPIAMVATPDQAHLVVMTRGQEALAKGEQDEAPGLYLVDANRPASPPIRYEIGSPFDRVAIAADGSLAVAYFSAGGPDSEGLFRNPNELAVVDLARPPGALNPTLRTVRAFGSAPIGVVLSPPMGIPGDPAAEPRVFAFVLAPNTVTILDATHPSRREVSVRLTLGASALVTPRELAFAPAAGATYVRADGASDVLEIQLAWEAPDDDTDNDYQPSLSELGARGAPADIAVYDDLAGIRRMIAVSPSTREVTVVDADTGAYVQVDAGDAVDRVLLLPESAPRVAVLASVGARTPRLQILDLEHIGNVLTPPSIEDVPLAAPMFDVVSVPGHELVMLVHDDSRTVLGLLDVVTRAVAPLEGAGRLDSYDFAAGGAYLVGATSNVSRVGVVDLANLHPDDVRLDALPGEVMALPNGAVVVDHRDPFGLVTILPTAAAGRREARVVAGFLLAGLLDEEL
jgi:hypothetical protein